MVVEMKSILIIAIVLLSKTAFSQSSAIIFEPYAGYHFGDYEIKYVGNSEKDDVDGVGAGLKLGTLINGVRASLEGMYSKVKLKGDENEAKDAEHLIYGIHIGLNLPGNVKLFGGYFLRSELDVEFPNPTGNVKFRGKAYKGGVGIPMGSDLHLNIEYIKNDYDKVETRTGTVDIDQSGFREFKHSSIFVNFSYPFGLRGSAN